MFTLTKRGYASAEDEPNRGISVYDLSSFGWDSRGRVFSYPAPLSTMVRSRAMNLDVIARVRSKWSKFDKLSLKDMMKIDLLDLVEMLRETYGFSRLQAERECHEFQLTLKPALTHSVPGRFGFADRH